MQFDRKHPAQLFKPVLLCFFAATFSALSATSAVRFLRLVRHPSTDRLKPKLAGRVSHISVCGIRLGVKVIAGGRD